VRKLFLPSLFSCALLAACVVCAAACGRDEGDAGVSTPPADDAAASPAIADAATDAPVVAPPPSLEAPPPITVDEEQELSLKVPSTGITRFEAEGLPPGARFDRATGTLTFRPDFTQSGAYDVSITGHAGGAPAPFVKTVHASVTVRDSIAPIAPVIVSTVAGAGFTRLVVRQITDTFLDSPGRAGRTFDAVVVVPTSASAATPAPVVVSLHGFGGGPNANASSTTTFRIEPHDTDDTYWWGYGESLPGAPPTAGHVPAYTMRRVLHLVDWLRRTYPAADADRVFASGGSMGGAGALTLGLFHARHFAGIDATIAPAIPRNHRPSRVAQLTTLWGSPAANLDGTWDLIDLTRVMRDLPEARDQFVFTKHGKDDPTIHFGAVVTPSPLTKKTVYATFEEEHIGHLSVWDEGAHGPADPVLGDRWWDASWSRISDPKSYLTRRAPFPAFSRSSANGNPGDGTGNGKVPFSAESGYSASLAVPGDTGWSGDLAGALNRFLRWDTSTVIDTRDKLAISLYVVTSPGTAAPAAGYPTKGDLYTGPLPIRADVTPRRAQAFRLSPGESVRWRFGGEKGTVVAAGDGSVTVPGVGVGGAATVLEIERDPP
jgi:poly(3-hydroxybutyrate) depolymerase